MMEDAIQVSYSSFGQVMIDQMQSAYGAAVFLLLRLDSHQIVTRSVG